MGVSLRRSRRATLPVWKSWSGSGPTTWSWSPGTGGGPMRTTIAAARFILGPRAGSQERRVVEHLEQQGTGGTPLATFLKKIRDDTKPAVIGDN